MRDEDSRVKIFDACGLLEVSGWNSPDPGAYPTGGELIDHYLHPLATRTPLRERIRTSSRVLDVSRGGFDKVKTDGRDKAPFEIRYRNGAGVKSVLARGVIDAFGTWHSPYPARANRLKAIGEDLATSRIAHGMPDVLGRERSRYEGRAVAVLVAGHSAAGTLPDLVQLQAEAPDTRVIWIVRGSDPSKSFGGGSNDKLTARGQLGLELANTVEAGSLEVHSGFRVHLPAMESGLRVGAGSACCGRHVVVDQLIVATGFRPDLDFRRELRRSLDPTLECPPVLAPLIDPNIHSCGTVRSHGARDLAHPEPGLYVAGIKSYGRAPTFLMATGYEQVRPIAAELAGDHDVARRVELDLPDTGVCSVTRSAKSTGEGCCYDQAPVKSDAGSCCTASEKSKEAVCCT